MTHQDILDFIRHTFGATEFIPLHAPHFGGNEREYVVDTINSTFVSSVGAYVTRFEEMMCDITNAKFAIATVNGTTALHLALLVAGVRPGDEVITQPLTFVATANAIVHANAHPVFVDVDTDTLGMSPAALKNFLKTSVDTGKDGVPINKKTGKRIAACIPMHTFGLPGRIDQIADICKTYNIPLIEDAAESLGSYYKDKHTGTFGQIGTFSFNGNKTVTCGGGGAIVTNDPVIAAKAKHLSTTAKVPHMWEFMHDEVAYNYRMPNLNAALACAQLEQLPGFIENKRALASLYADFFNGSDIHFVKEMPAGKSNYWLNTIVFPDNETQQAFLKISNENKVMTRPVWKLMTTLPMFASCQTDGAPNATWLEKRVVNLPSSFRTGPAGNL